MHSAVPLRWEPAEWSFLSNVTTRIGPSSRPRHSVRACRTRGMRRHQAHNRDDVSMRAPEMWYDAIDVHRFLKAMDSQERREQIRERLESVGEKDVPEFLYPKLAEHRGTTPQIKDDPPLISIPRPSRRRAWSRATRKRSRFTASRWPSTCGPCSIASISAIWR